MITWIIATYQRVKQCGEYINSIFTTTVPQFNGYMCTFLDSKPHYLKRKKIWKMWNPDMDMERTMLIEWFEMNTIFEEAMQLKYVEMLTKFFWDTKDKMYSARKQRGTIGRIVNIHPTAGELYYLRILVNVTKGPMSFNDLLTV